MLDHAFSTVFCSASLWSLCVWEMVQMDEEPVSAGGTVSSAKTQSLPRSIAQDSLVLIALKNTN